MNDLHKLRLSVLVAASTVFAVPNSALAFFDDFEDGNTNGWLETTTASAGSFGSYGVEFHNVSQMAFSKHTGDGQHAPSMDFNYSPAELLSFDMHAVAVGASGSAVPARSGVAVSFLTQFNVPLGTAGLYRVTDLSWLPANSNAIDDVQHNYHATMASFASLAGLDPANSAIAKLSISFQATAAYSFSNAPSSASVWFDNVSVPEPGTSALVLTGLAMFAAGARRRRTES